MDPATGLDARIGNMRNHIATVFGLILPEIRLTDNRALDAGSYRIRIQGVEQARDRLRPDQVLALTERSGGCGCPRGAMSANRSTARRARWIAPALQEDAALSGLTVVGPTEVVATHLLEIVKRNFGRLLTLQDPAASAVDEFVQPDRHRTGRGEPEADRRIRARQGAGRHAAGGAPAAARGAGLDPQPAADPRSDRRSCAARPGRRLPANMSATGSGFQLVAELRREDGTIPLIQLAPEWEETFQAHHVEGDRGQTDVALPPDAFNRLAANVAERLARAGERGISPALVTASRRRRFLRTVLGAKGIAIPVLSVEEIGADARPSIVGLVPA